MPEEMKIKLLKWLETATEDDIKKLDNLVDELKA